MSNFPVKSIWLRKSIPNVNFTRIYQKRINVKIIRETNKIFPECQFHAKNSEIILFLQNTDDRFFFSSDILEKLTFFVEKHFASGWNLGFGKDDGAEPHSNEDFFGVTSPIFHMVLMNTNF